METKTQVKVSSNLPEKKFRAGSITATVWENQTKNAEGNTISYRTVSITKSYKDKDGRWKNTNTLRMNDIPKANLVLSKAYEFLALSESNGVEIELH